MKLPEINETITTGRGLELCQHFGFDDLAARIQDNTKQYKEWTFDGVSMAPDRLLKKLLRTPKLTEIALRHDLKYAYGRKGDKEEKMRADLALQKELIAGGTSRIIAWLMFKAVVLYGQEHFQFRFSWAFASQ